MSEPMEPELTLKQLRCFLHVAESGGFRRAAERLNVTQPSLSAQIQALETTLSVQLVERSRAGAQLTPVGREIAERARAVLDAAAEVIDFASKSKPGLAGALRLGVTPSIGPYLLPRVVSRLRSAYPELRLLIGEAPPNELTRLLAEGRYDLVVTQLPTHDSSLAAEELFREPLYLVLSADHPLAAKTAVAPEDLAGLEVLSLDARHQLHGQVAELCDIFGARFVDYYEGASLDALRLMVGARVGVAFLPSLYVGSEIRPGGDVVARKIKGRSISRHIGLVWRKRAGGVSDYRTLASMLRDAYASLIKEQAP